MMDIKYLVQTANSVYELVSKKQGGYTIQKVFALKPQPSVVDEEKLEGTHVVLNFLKGLELWNKDIILIRTSEVFLITRIT